jgi:peptidyl-prolyl cis-trans isomerase C
MTPLRIIAWVAGLLLGSAIMAGCEQPSPEAAGPRPVYGDGVDDGTRVVATVNGFEITERMLDERYAELPRQEQLRFRGPEGRRVYLRRMVDEVLRVQAARRDQIALEPDVRRQLIAAERRILVNAFDDEIGSRREPTVDEVREYFEAHRENYKRAGVMSARHIEVSSREQADEAYREATEGGVAFPRLVARYSENATTRDREGLLGYFNKGGFIDGIDASARFIDEIWELEPGIHPPFEFRGRWHVVKVLERRYERLQTLDEAYDRVVHDMEAEFRAALVDEWLRQHRGEAEIAYFGEFRPGEGKTPAELLERATLVADPQQKLDLLALLVDDYPGSEEADDALFMAGSVALESYSDARRAAYFYRQLIERYPDSPLAPDVQYLLDNLGRPGFVNPTSIEDLRGQGE